MDVTDPAPNIAGIDKLTRRRAAAGRRAARRRSTTLPPDEQAEFEKFDQWATPYPQPFQTQLAAFVNLADDYQQTGAAANADADLDESIRSDPDPLITPPLYGRWHALTERLLTDRDGADAPHRTNWVHELNLDPRWRVGGGLRHEGRPGQAGSATWRRAWEQIGDVLEATAASARPSSAKVAGMHLHDVHVQGGGRGRTVARAAARPRR